NGSAVYEMGPASVPLERAVVHRLGGTLGLGPERGGILCHGGTMANAVALLAARATRAGGDVWNDGATEPLALLVSEQAHYCVDRIVRIMGWGADGVIAVPADSSHRMKIEELPGCLERARAKGRKVIAIVGSACTTSVGAYDNLNGIADFASAHNLWFHVDGAHGAPAAFSATHRECVAGLGRADSVTMDFHKLMGLPTLCTGLFYQREGDSFAAFAQKADYLFAADERQWWDMGKRTFECTKRSLSLRIKALLDVHGEALWGDLVDRLFGLAREFATAVDSRGQWQLAVPPEANIVCFRHRPDGIAGAALDEHNEALRARLLEQGPQYIVQTRFGGSTWLRVTMMNPMTTGDDISCLLDRLETLAKL
ncbi:MAG: pyridoxal-dependent decarboxylase, partial [Pseudomonadota bacterium]